MEKTKKLDVHALVRQEIIEAENDFIALFDEVFEYAITEREISSWLKWKWTSKGWESKYTYALAA